MAAQVPHQRRRRLPPEEEDASQLKFGSDFKDAEPLSMSETAIIFSRDHGDRQNTPIYQKTLDYVKQFGKFHNEEAVTEIRKTLFGRNVHKFELAQLMNLCPEEVEEAKTLIPRQGAKMRWRRILAHLSANIVHRFPAYSLANKFSEDTLREMLDEIATLKKFQS